jgi:uncharacterized protein (DUF58 family)
MTPSGWFFFLLMALIMAAALSSGHNLLYLAVCLFFGSFITMGNVAVMNLRGLVVEREEPGYVFAGTPSPVEIRVLNNRRIMDSFSLEVREMPTRAEKKIGRVFFPLVEKEKETSRSYYLVAPARGWFDLAGLEVLTRFPFGFWERSRAIPMPLRLLVFPKVFERWPEEPSNLAVDGEFLGKRLGTGDDLLNFRDFQRGDPVRWIHWKNSAKTDHLTVAVFHHPENRQVIVCLQTAYEENADSNLAAHFEEAVSWAATAVYRLIDRGVSVGYMDEKARFPPAQGEGHKIQILTHLALLKIELKTRKGLVELGEASSGKDEFIRIEASQTGVRILSAGQRHPLEELTHA